MAETVSVKPPAPCLMCKRARGFWRYRDSRHWHCVACAPCPDADDAAFDWDAPAVGDGFYVYGRDEREPGEEG